MRNAIFAMLLTAATIISFPSISQACYSPPMISSAASAKNIVSAKFIGTKKIKITEKYSQTVNLFQVTKQFKGKLAQEIIQVESNYGYYGLSKKPVKCSYLQPGSLHVLFLRYHYKKRNVFSSFHYSFTHWPVQDAKQAQEVVDFVKKREYKKGVKRTWRYEVVRLTAKGVMIRSYSKEKKKYIMDARFAFVPQQPATKKVSSKKVVSM